MISVNGIKTAFRRLKYRLKHDFLPIENIVLIIAIAMCLTWTYQSIEAMSRNWELTDRLNSDNRTLELLKIEVEAAELENEYYTSNEYQELAARKFANKQLPGENMVYMPANSEVAKNKHRVVSVAKAEKEYSNVEKWWMYLFPNR